MFAASALGPKFGSPEPMQRTIVMVMLITPALVRQKQEDPRIYWRDYLAKTVDPGFRKRGTV